MNIQAIVYTSNTGHTAQYARLLAKKTGLRAYPLEEAEEHVPLGAEIIYMGWIMVGKVQGLLAAARRYHVMAVCAVGVSPTGSQLAVVRQANGLGEETPLFTLQGGLELSKLHGVKKLLLKSMGASMGRALLSKDHRTAEEEATLDLFRRGGSCVSMQNLHDVAAWYEAQKK